MLRYRMSIPVWNIGFIEKKKEDILKDEPYKIAWMKHDYSDRSFADPFLSRETEKYYEVLAEEFKLIEDKGRIVRLVVDKETKRVVDKSYILKTAYHLSYPERRGHWLVPEQSEGGQLVAYDLVNRKKRIVAKTGLIDATFFAKGNKKWVFATLQTNDPESVKKTLYRFECIGDTVDIDSGKLIRNDYEGSRMAGDFFEIDGVWYRPSQNSNEDFYGESVTIFRVDCCDDAIYKETAIRRVDSHNEKHYYDGLHTFNVYDSVSIVDGVELRLNPILKTVFKINKWRKKKYGNNR